jgi:dihydroflavonol-4-reductase
MIGPYDFQPSYFGATIIAAAQGKLPALVDAGLNWVDTRDVSKGMIHAGERAKAGDKYILSGHWANLKDIVKQVSQFSGHNLPRVLPLWMAKASAPLVSTLDQIKGKRQLFTPISMKELESNKYLSHAKASRELGYEPRPLQRTIADTLEWFQSSGFIH